MFFYEVGYSSYEECPVRVICHEKQFTTEEFDEMILDCYVRESKDAQTKQNEWLSKETDLTEEDKEWYRYKPSVSSLFTNVHKLLLSDYGFTEPTITSSFVISDTEDIVARDDRDFRETYCDKLKKLRQRFNVIEPRDNKINDILDKN